MLKKIIVFLFALNFPLCFILNAQNKNLVSVNPNTGLASVVIPLYSFSRGEITFPLSIGYTSSGVKVKDGPGNAGMGWNLIAGGQIKRKVRGLPDDVESGWLKNSNGTKINNFTIANDSNNETCSDEQADNTYINNNFNDNSDTEPDLFSVTAPGLSCQFVFGNDHAIKTIPYKDVQISYGVDYLGRINYFEIIDDKGSRYSFHEAESVQKVTETNNPNDIHFFKSEFKQYKSGVVFNDVWHLSSVIDRNGNGVNLNYTDFGNGLSSNRVVVTLNDPNNLNLKEYQYTTKEFRNNRKVLTSVQSAKDTAQVAIEYNRNMAENESLNRITGGGRNIIFSYNYIKNVPGYSRSFLTSVYDVATNSPFKYNFSYIGYNSFDGLSSDNDILPDTSSKQIDYWGYYAKNQNISLLPSLYINPNNLNYPTYKIQASNDIGTAYTYSIPGSNRMADPNSAMTGTLNKITYGEGGTTTLAYELNDYYDPSTAKVIKGGGIRIHSITDFDGLNIANNDVRTYSYINPATNLSSGIPLTLPLYAFTRPYSGTGSPADLWKYSTVLSENDLSTEDESILYSHVTLTQPNAGKTLYEYLNPGMFWVRRANDWSSTFNYIARSNCSVTDLTKNAPYSYPFAPNTNYDFERGLLKKVTNYNSSQVINETSYAYTRTGLPIIITGLRIDSNMNNRVYTKYNIYTTCSELLTQETKIIYDYNGGTQHQQTSLLSYYYDSPKHKLITKQTAVNSDGSISGTQITYTKDYTIPATLDSNLLTIQNMQRLNINLPVEKQFTIQRNGVTKTIGADLTKFSAFTARLYPLYLPTQKLSFLAANGVTDFQPFNPSTGTFIKDSRYIPIENYTRYDVYGYLQTKNDNNKRIESYFVDRFVGLPSARILNAAYNEVAILDFDSYSNGNTFRPQTILPNGYIYANDSHSGTKAVVLSATETMSAGIHKNNQSANYVFSCWLSSSATNTITLTINSNGSNIPYTLPVGNSSGKWKYYELKIPVRNVAADFTVSFQCANQINIDDILFYPENASIETATYDFTRRQKSSETNANGVTTYYSYDPYGRLLSVLDQDKQIVLKKSYVRYSNKPVVDYASPGFRIDYLAFRAYPQRKIQFTNTTTINNPDVTDIIYTWDFGDGTPIVTGLNAWHTFASPGDYSVKLTATSATKGKLSTTSIVTIAPLPAATTSLLYSNLSLGGEISRIVFKQGSEMVYSVGSAALTSGFSIIPDQYTIEITVSGTTSNYNSVSFKHLDIAKICFSNLSGNAPTAVYTLTNDLRNASTVVFTIDINACGSGAIIPK